MDYEIGHINISVPDSKSNAEQLPGDEDDRDPVVGWHRDSYPFVCVLMMSDTTDMIGGETALRTGTGAIKKVRGPTRVRQHLDRKAPANMGKGMCGRHAGSLY